MTYVQSAGGTGFAFAYVGGSDNRSRIKYLLPWIGMQQKAIRLCHSYMRTDQQGLFCRMPLDSEILFLNAAVIVAADLGRLGSFRVPLVVHSSQRNENWRPTSCSNFSFCVVGQVVRSITGLRRGNGAGHMVACDFI
jgi:3-hydroxymyristoyl/3-hydroxydecanoyl-(acyl carrier protein) dehydratase